VRSRVPGSASSGHRTTFAYGRWVIPVMSATLRSKSGSIRRQVAVEPPWLKSLLGPDPATGQPLLAGPD
jgi:hypothetical protein